MLGVIVNPVSGSGKGLKVWKQVAGYLTKASIRFNIKFTSETGHASKIFDEYLKQSDIEKILVVGGDGTISEAIQNGINTNRPISLGYIPAGTGNDLAKSLGISLHPLAALKQFLNGTEKMLDIGMVGERLFINSFGVGFDGAVVKAMQQNKLKKRLNYLKLGSLSYLFSIMSVLRSYQPLNISLFVDSHEYQIKNVWMVVVANQPYYGGGMKICPDACANDGIFEICVINGLTRWQIIRYIPMIYKGTHVNLPYVKVIRGQRVSIHSEQRMNAQADGEIKEYINEEISSMREKISIIY
jgi:diacylglycerol kinase (ATP)